MRQQIERAIAHGEIHAAHHQSDQQRHVFATPHQQRRETNQNATSSQMYVGMNSRRAMTSDTSMNPPPLVFTECSCAQGICPPLVGPVEDDGLVGPAGSVKMAESAWAVDDESRFPCVCVPKCAPNRQVRAHSNANGPVCVPKCARSSFRRALKDANACCVRLHAAPSSAAAQPVGGGCPCRPCAQPYRGRSADLRQN